MDTYVNSVTTYLFAQSWQIGLLALIVGLISFALKKRSAHIRYLLWLIVLAKCLIPPLYSVPVPVLPDKPSIEKMSVQISAETPLADSKINKADTPVEIHVVNASQDSGFALPSAKQIIALAWLLGVFLFLLWIVFRAVRYTLWLRSRRTLLPVHLKHKLQEPLDCLNFKKSPRIWLTKDIGQPFVWGLLRGSVYLPVDFTDLDNPQHNRTVMVHELSHIIRYDAAINLIQILSQAIFWFHPVVWWMNKKIRQEREKCCDEMVVAQFSTAPEHYTDAIIEALTAERRSAHPVPSLAIVGSVKDIEERIKTMLRPGKRFYKRPSVIALINILLFAFLIVPIGCVLTNKSETKTVTEQKENTPKSLFEAIWASDPDEVKRLIANGVDVNATDPDNQGVKYTPLMAAANGGFAEVAKVLLENKAEVNATDFQGWTALYYAFWLYSSDDNEKKHRERAELVKALITSGADVNKKNQGISPLINAITTGTPRLGGIEALLDGGADLYFKDKRGLTPLYYAAFDGDRNVLDLIIERGNYADTIHLAACKGDMDKVRTLLEKGTDVNSKDEFGCTPLHWAARARSPEVAGLLIANGADINAKAGPDNLTPFMAARKLPVIELLVSKGVDINSQENLSKLHGACFAGDIQVVRFLIDKGADINTRNGRGATPLWSAAMSDQKEVVELLLGKGADINAPGRRGATPLGIAARNGNKETLEFLIEKGANIHTPDDRGMTPLDLAKQWGWTEIVELLKKHGVKEDTADISQDTKEIKSIHQAAANGNIERVKELLDQGVPVDATDDMGRTPLHCASYEDHDEIVLLLVSKGADVNAQEAPEGKPLHATALHHAVHNDNKNLVEFLIAHGANVIIKDRRGQIPLVLASRRGRRSGNTEIVELLTKAAQEQINVENKTSQDNSPTESRQSKQLNSLHQAVSKGDLEQVKKFIEEGVDVNAKDVKGYTPLYHAVWGPQPDIVEILVANGADVNLVHKRAVSPLFWAIVNEQIDIVRTLVDSGANYNANENYNPNNPFPRYIWLGTAFSRALWSGNSDLVDILIKKGANASTIHLSAAMGNIQAVNAFLKQEVPVDAKDEMDFTPLFWATSMGRKEVVELLLDHGANVNYKASNHTIDNHTIALHHAARVGAHDVTQILIDHGSDINAEDGHGYTPLFRAIQGRRGSHIRIVELLITNGADINVMIMQGKGWSPLHWVSAVGRIEMAKILISNGADASMRNKVGRTPLDLANKYGHTEIIELLCKHRAKDDVVSKKENTQLRTPLHQVAAKGDVQIEQIRSLIARGVDVNARDEKGQTPLHCAVSSDIQIIGVVELLIKHGADVNAEDDNGRTPVDIAMDLNRGMIFELLMSHGGHSSLQTAAFVGDVHAVRGYIKKVADINTKDCNGKTALHYAAIYGHLDVITALFANDMNLNEKDKNGNTALHYASKSGNHEVIEFLLANSAHVNEKDANGNTPIELYVLGRRARREIVDLYLKNGAETSIYIAAYLGDLTIIKDLVEKDSIAVTKSVNGNTPLHMAIRVGNRSVAEYLISKGVNVNARDDLGFTPLAVAALKGHTDFVKMLIDKGAEITADQFKGALLGGHNEIVEILLAKGPDTKAIGDEGILHWAVMRNNLEAARSLIRHGVDVEVKWRDRTALYHAVTDGSKEFCRLLIVEGADVNAKNIRNWTPLHAACAYNQKDKVELFLSARANMSTRTAGGRTPIELASERGHSEIVELLRKHGAK